MTTILLSLAKSLLLALLGTAPLHSTTGFATVFGQEGDALVGGRLACLHRHLRPNDMVCAHRTLPCGTSLLVMSLRTRRVTVCQVGDRGPYGAVLPNGEIILKLRAAEEGVWRGLVDLSPGVARAIGQTGRQQVVILWGGQSRH